MTGTLLVPVGRDFGQYGEENGVKYFAVGSMLNKVILTHVEYYTWKMIRNYKSLEEWKKQLQTKLATKFKNIDMNEILVKLASNSLVFVWEFPNPEDQLLQVTHIIRNGTPGEKVGDKWYVNGPFKQDSIGLTDQQYALWNAAGGYASIIDTLAQAMTDLNIEEDEKIIELLTTEGINLVRVGLWDLDILAENGEENNGL